MPEPTLDLIWIVPAAIGVGVAAIVIAVLAWLVHRVRRSPRARAAAESARADAGAALVRLDDAVEELDLDVSVSGALSGGDASAQLRRARMTAQHVRDDVFAQYAALSDPALLPGEIRRRSHRVQSRIAPAIAAIGSARAEHGAWVAAHVSAADEVAAARRRLAELRETMGDPDALVRELEARFDPVEWRDAAAAAADATAAADEAERCLAVAASYAGDRARPVAADLATAERAMRRARSDARTLEETHRVVTQAAEALPGEFEAIRGAMRQALAMRPHLAPAAAGRLSDEVRAIEASVIESEADAARRPTATVDRIARLRHRLDLALGDTRTAQQRIRASRTALPGTLAAARGAIAHAEASVLAAHTGADARVKLAAAQRELAASRNVTDPVAALDAARRAIQLAEDAGVVAENDR